LYNELYHIVYAAWVPEHNVSKISSPAHYLRFALTPQYKGWDFGIYAFNFQAMGNIGRPLTITLTYGNAKNESNSLFNTGTDNKTAITGLAEVGLVPDRFLMSIGYRNATDENGNSDDAEMVGAKYMLNRNVQLQLDYAHYNDQSEKNDYLFMLSSAF